MKLLITSIGTKTESISPNARPFRDALARATVKRKRRKTCARPSWNALPSVLISTCR